MYEELIAPQRLKLHQQVARSLGTQYARRLEEHAAELAEHFSQSAVRVGLRQAVELLSHRFAGTRMCFTFLIPTSIHRYLGAAAALLGRPDNAREYYQEALKATTEMRFRPELALTHLQLAELLLGHYPAEKTDALEHLDIAIKEFREMKMQPSLDRALKLRA
jgi:hypothetical protein